MSDSPPERRLAPRSSTNLVAEVELEGKVITCAVSRDASPTGLLLMTENAVEPGKKVHLRLWVGDGKKPIAVDASVVRCEKMDIRKSPVWSYEVAVALDERPADFNRVLDALAARPTS